MAGIFKRYFAPSLALIALVSSPLAAERDGWSTEQDGDVAWHKHESGRAQIIEFQSNSSTVGAAELINRLAKDFPLTDSHCPGIKDRTANTYSNGRASIQSVLSGKNAPGLCGFFAVTRNGKQNLVYWEQSFNNSGPDDARKLAEQMAEDFVGR